MPINRNAKKALRQSIKRRAHNRAARSALKTILKKAREAAHGSDVQAGQTALQQASKRLDQAVSKGQIHRNKAARLKSQLARAVNAKKSAT
jgi:small subunit ribosomal protein S20